MFNVVCGVCSIAGLLVSLFTASRVVKISSEVANKNKKSEFHGGYVGRDSINEAGSSEQK